MMTVADFRLSTAVSRKAFNVEGRESLVDNTTVFLVVNLQLEITSAVVI